MHEYTVKHVAIIPDGNRRWAKKQGKPSWFGHKKGARVFEDILKRALDLDVYCLSFWGMSLDNFSKREKREVSFLLGLFEDVIKKALSSKDLEENDTRISILGEWRMQFPKKLIKIFDDAIDSTLKRRKHIVNLLLAYDGRSEMQRAFELARGSASDTLSPKEFLFTKDLPPVDLVIRTGGDPHLSTGFMMWDTADAQLWFSDKLWPEFTASDFEGAVRDFLRRERRFGA